MSDHTHIRVFTVDDHPLLQEGIAAIINNHSDMQLVAQATSGSDAIQKFREHQPDITLMDLRLPDMTGIDAMIAIRAAFPEARIIMLTTFEGDVDIKRALEAGAWAYMLKSMPPRDLVAVIRQVHSGKRPIRAVAAQLPDHLGEQILTPGEMDRTQAVAVATGWPEQHSSREPNSLTESPLVRSILSIWRQVFTRRTQ
jgi:DNA-binding NarL/FixJ family response regulator